MKNPHQCEYLRRDAWRPLARGTRCRRRAIGKLYPINGEGSIKLCRDCAQRYNSMGMKWQNLTS